MGDSDVLERGRMSLAVKQNESNGSVQELSSLVLLGLMTFPGGPGCCSHSQEQNKKVLAQFRVFS